jgi:hypothetical protein
MAQLRNTMHRKKVCRTQKIDEERKNTHVRAWPA